MPPKLAVVEKNGVVRGACCLQSRRHFSGVKRIAVPVGVTRNEHRCRISYALLNSVVWRVFCESSKIFEIVRRSKLVAPDMRIIEEVIAQHVQHRNHAYNGSKEIRPLRHCCSNEKSRIRAAKDGKFSWMSSSGFDEPFGCAEEIVVGGLAIVSFCSVMPLHAKLRTAANVRQRKQATTFHEKGDKDAELWRHGNTISAVRGHDRWAITVLKCGSISHEVHGDSRSVL